MADKMKPIKRSKELAQLSREHHDGLLLCWKIKEGMANNIGVERIRAYVLYFFDHHLAPHFNDEEQFIFPLLPADNIQRVDAEQQHKMLREAIDSIRDTQQIEHLSLRYFAEMLNEHIRFEERVLFPLIEQEAAPEALQAAATQLTMNGEYRDEWEDPFWLRKK